jgi:hypothetical protein
MPIQLEQVPGENILIAINLEPFDPQNDMPSMFAQFMRSRQTMIGPVALIVDFNNTNTVPTGFTRVVLSLGEVAKGIRANKQAQLAGPPILIFVGSGSFADLVTGVVEHEHYGGAKAQLCATKEEAIALAREKLAALGG